MKYENIEFERNFQLKPTVRTSTETSNEPNTSSSTSVRTHQESEETRDDIQVNAIKTAFLQKNDNAKSFWMKLNKM